MINAVKDAFINKANWLCFISGFSLVLAYAPFSLWWLALCLPLGLVHCLYRAKSNKEAFKYGFIFAFGWFASGISWVHVSIDQFGGLPLAISLLLMLLLCLYLALFPALACYLTQRFSNSNNKLWLLPSFWLLSEYLRSVVLTGFPWLSLGYSQIDSPLAHFAPVIGEVGITAIILLINISLYLIISANRVKIEANVASNIIPSTLVLMTIGIATFVFAKTTWVTATGEKLKTALIQGNIEQSMKWQPENEWPTMLKYLDLTRVNYDADLIIWPESAIPALEPTVQDYLSTVNSSAILNNSTIITGIINYNFETKEYFNALITLGNTSSNNEQGYYYNHNNRYYKNHLLPIGEFVPFQAWLRPLAPFFNLPMSSFSRGDYVQANLQANGLAILPLICFEIAFPHQLAANLTDNTDILLTVSNDAWFGDSHGPHQHLDIARMRALEFGRPLLRSTNTGITAVVDHFGQVTGIIPQFEQAVLKAQLDIVTGKTPYSQWPQLILSLMILMPLMIIKGISARQLN
ncbi:apolipoprotein N-acyltransferase [Litorilituus sediminis]|uniref:Apolipoprotein N-acyltransferase n=1 Tax=Litorilituus sediminis TaxID=718192 RepID=A0A4P6PCR3_9GAMM|nr:apolipoprotein N-acyltransferase [Litorilituus sediminis]QBG37562.1 apolipoprotein N-acyltransferase [Litorilituus sediminis]